MIFVGGFFLFLYRVFLNLLLRLMSCIEYEWILFIIRLFLLLKYSFMG